jgi:hypothetical protein
MTDLEKVPTFKLESTLEQFGGFLNRVSYNVGEELLIDARAKIVKELARRKKLEALRAQN